MGMMEQQNQFVVTNNNMKFLFALFVSVLFVSAFGEEDEKKVDKRHIVVGIHGSPWPFYDAHFHHYYHTLLKRDTSAHSIQKREVAEEAKNLEGESKNLEKRDLVLGYGGYPYFRSYPYYARYPSYYNYYNNYGLFY